MDRDASEKEKEKELPTLKDNDLIKDGTKIHITEDSKTNFMDMLNADVTVSILPPFFSLRFSVFPSVSETGRIC